MSAIGPLPLQPGDVLPIGDHTEEFPELDQAPVAAISDDVSRIYVQRYFPPAAKRAADALVPVVSGALFATADLRGAVASFLADGPGKATYAGR